MPVCPLLSYTGSSAGVYVVGLDWRKWIKEEDRQTDRQLGEFRNDPEFIRPEFRTDLGRPRETLAGALKHKHNYI